MTKLVNVILSACFMANCCFAQTHQQKTQVVNDFILDKSKPYVYLEAIHVGPREPVRSTEPKVGIWFRLHNNCEIPIIVRTFGVSKSDKPNEIGVLDQVVANPAPDLRLIDSNSLSSENAPSSQELSQSTEMPYGYMFDTYSSAVIGPGKSVYFSLPRNHVTKKWHFEIAFRFAVTSKGPVRQPYNFVACFWEDLPETLRDALSGTTVVPPKVP